MVAALSHSRRDVIREGKNVQVREMSTGHN